MASFKFTSTVPDEGATFAFSSWIGGFNSHLAKSRDPKVQVAT